MIGTLLVFISIPLVSAMIGWVTNYLAVKMIFRPHRPVRVLGITILGLIPRRQADLARKIGETVERELISHRDIHQAVNTDKFREEVIRVIIDRMDDFIFRSLGSHPLVAALLAGEMAATIKDLLRSELREQLPVVLEDLFTKMEQRLDVKEIIRAKIESFDLSKLEDIIYNIASKELKAIEIMGGILGFVVGIVQVTIIAIGGIYG